MLPSSAIRRRAFAAVLCSTILTSCASAPRYPADFSPQQQELSVFATARLKVVTKQLRERLATDDKDRVYENALRFKQLTAKDSSWLRLRAATEKARLDEQRWLGMESDVLRNVAFSRGINDFNSVSRYGVSRDMLKWSNWATETDLPAARDAALAGYRGVARARRVSPDIAQREALAVGMAWTRAMEARHAFVMSADRALAVHGHPSLAEQYVNARVARERVREIQRQNDRAASSEAQIKWMIGLAAYVGLSLVESALYNRPTMTPAEKEQWLKEMAERRARKKSDCRAQGKQYQEGMFSFDEGYCY